MPVKTAATSKTKRLSAVRESAILTAAYELLSEVGYEALRFDAVASRASASKATLYRHWPTKPELVADAIRHGKIEGVQAPDTGTLRGDLMARCDLLAEQIRADEGPVLAGLFMAMHNDPGLAAVLRPMLAPGVPQSETICARAEARGELRPGSDAGLIDELSTPLFFMRQFALGLPLNDLYIAHVVDDIILPLLNRTPRP